MIDFCFSKKENQKNKNDFVVNISDKKQSVYIDGSESIVVTVKGKFTNITVGNAFF